MTVTAVAFLASPLATTADHPLATTRTGAAPPIWDAVPDSVRSGLQTSWSTEAFLLAAALATAASWACSTPPCSRHQSWPDSGRV
jgi:hypothetical protein